MTKTPEQTTRDADDAELEMLEYEMQDAEEQRERTAMNSRHYHELTSQIATLNAAIARHQLEHPRV